VFVEDLGVLLDLLLVSILRGFDQDQQRYVCLQKAVQKKRQRKLQVVISRTINHCHQSTAVQGVTEDGLRDNFKNPDSLSSDETEINQEYEAERKH
jgi:hypothetical protein